MRYRQLERLCARTAVSAFAPAATTTIAGAGNASRDHRTPGQRRVGVLAAAP